MDQPPPDQNCCPGHQEQKFSTTESAEDPHPISEGEKARQDQHDQAGNQQAPGLLEGTQSLAGRIHLRDHGAGLLWHRAIDHLGSVND